GRRLRSMSIAAFMAASTIATIVMIRRFRSLRSLHRFLTGTDSVWPVAPVDAARLQMAGERRGHVGEDAVRARFERLVELRLGVERPHVHGETTLVCSRNQPAIRDSQPPDDWDALQVFDLIEAERDLQGD